MVACERLGPPNVRVVGVLHAQHDSGVAHMADVNLAATYESDAGRGARRAWQPTRRLGPLL